MTKSMKQLFVAELFNFARNSAELTKDFADTGFSEIRRPDDHRKSHLSGKKRTAPRRAYKTRAGKM